MTESNEDIEKLVNLIKARDTSLLSRQCSASAKLTAGLLIYSDPQGNSAFSHAVASGHVDTVKLFLKMGADATKSNDYGWTPLCHASYHGHKTIVKFLLENTVQYQNEATVFGWTALMSATYAGNYAIAKYLVDAGVYVNSAGAGSTGQGTGMTPLMVACFKGYLRIAKLLLDRGAEQNTQCQLNGWSPLMFAANGSMKRASASKETDNKGDTEVVSNRLAMVEMLLSYGTDPLLCNWGGKGAIEIASETGQNDVYELLRKVVGGERKSRKATKEKAIAVLSLTNSGVSSASFHSALKKSEAEDGNVCDELEESYGADKKSWFDRIIKRKPSVIKSSDQAEAPQTPPSFEKKRVDNGDVKLSIGGMVDEIGLKNNRATQSASSSTRSHHSSQQQVHSPFESKQLSMAQISREASRVSVSAKPVIEVSKPPVNAFPTSWPQIRVPLWADGSPVPSPTIPITLNNQYTQQIRNPSGPSRTMHHEMSNASLGESHSSLGSFKGGTSRPARSSEDSRVTPIRRDDIPVYDHHIRSTSERPSADMRGTSPVQPQNNGESLAYFLDRLELRNYLSLFEAASLDLNAVLNLDEEDFKELGIKLSSHRRQLLNACATQKENVGPTRYPKDRKGSTKARKNNTMKR